MNNPKLFSSHYYMLTLQADLHLDGSSFRFFHILLLKVNITLSKQGKRREIFFFPKMMWPFFGLAGLFIFKWKSLVSAVSLHRKWLEIMKIFQSKYIIPGLSFKQIKTDKLRDFKMNCFSQGYICFFLSYSKQWILSFLESWTALRILWI